MSGGGNGGAGRAITRIREPNPVTVAMLEACVERGITIITGTQVTNLVFDGAGRAVGVRRSRPGLRYVIGTNAADSTPTMTLTEWPATELRCSGDVIVSGGAIGSPQLLSGIGPAKWASTRWR